MPAQPTLSVADTFLLNVAVQGGTNAAALHTDEELRVTNPRGRKSNGKKETKTGPVDPDSLTGRGKKRKACEAGGVAKKQKGNKQGGGQPSRKRKVTNDEVGESETSEETRKKARVGDPEADMAAPPPQLNLEGLPPVARRLVIRIPPRVT